MKSYFLNIIFIISFFSFGNIYLMEELNKKPEKSLFAKIIGKIYSPFLFNLYNFSPNYKIDKIEQAINKACFKNMNNILIYDYIRIVVKEDNNELLQKDLINIETKQIKDKVKQYSFTYIKESVDKYIKELEPQFKLNRERNLALYFLGSFLAFSLTTGLFAFHKKTYFKNKKPLLFSIAGLNLSIGFISSILIEKIIFKFSKISKLFSNKLIMSVEKTKSFFSDLDCDLAMGIKNNVILNKIIFDTLKDTLNYTKINKIYPPYYYENLKADKHIQSDIYNFLNKNLEKLSDPKYNFIFNIVSGYNCIYTNPFCF